MLPRHLPSGTHTGDSELPDPWVMFLSRLEPALWIRKTRLLGLGTTGCQTGAVTTCCLGGERQKISWTLSIRTVRHPQASACFLSWLSEGFIEKNENKNKSSFLVINRWEGEKNCNELPYLPVSPFLGSVLINSLIILSSFKIYIFIFIYVPVCAYMSLYALHSHSIPPASSRITTERLIMKAWLVA